MRKELVQLLTKMGIGFIVADMCYWLWTKITNRKSKDKDGEAIVNEEMLIQLLDSAHDYTDSIQEETSKTFNLAQYDRYQVELDEATLIFYSKNIPIIKADIQIIGTHSKHSKTWMWSRLNEAFPAHAVERMEKVKACMEVVEWGNFNEVFEVDETFVDNAVALSVLLLEGKGFYRCPSTNTDVYVVMTDFHWIESQSIH